MSDISEMRAMAVEVADAFGVPVRFTQFAAQGGQLRQKTYDLDTGYSQVEQAGSFETVMIFPAPQVTPGFGAGAVTDGRGTIPYGTTTDPSQDWFPPKKRDTFELLDGPHAGVTYTIDHVEQRAAGSMLVVHFSDASGGPNTVAGGGSG